MYKSEYILELMDEEFPEERIKIAELFNESSNFVEICEDYVLCLESIHRLEVKKDPQLKKEISELKWALGELKEELLSRIY